MSRRAFWLFILIVAFAVDARAGEPAFALSEDGATLVYRAQPGDQPAAIAARFGIGRDGLDAFLAANGITDPNRVAVGHVYRIPNPLAVRAADAEARATAASAAADTARSEAVALRAQAASDAARANVFEERAGRLERLGRIWPWVQLVGAMLVIALGVVGFLAYRSFAELHGVEREVRRLGDELDERRRAALAERQQAARRILDLEETVHALEQELASRASIRRPTGTH